MWTMHLHVNQKSDYDNDDMKFKVAFRVLKTKLPKELQIYLLFEKKIT